MLLSEVARTWRSMVATRSRLAKVDLLSTCLRGLETSEIVPGVAYLSGELRQRQIGVGWAALRDLPEPAAAAMLSISDVDAAFATIGSQSGPGSQAERRRLLDDLFSKATADEQAFLRQLLIGELRQGALEGVMVDAIARAAEVPGPSVRRALLIAGDHRIVAETALTRGADGLAEFGLTIGQPLAPMLAQTAEDLPAALAKVSPAAIEEKLDGVRVQVHRDGDTVWVFTRSLDDITARVPEVVEVTRSLPLHTAILDGEAIALRPDGRPHPFQVTASRVGQRRAASGIQLETFFFDILHLDGRDLLDEPGTVRFDALAGVVPDSRRVRRIVSSDLTEVENFAADTAAHGHEGVMVKSLDTTYEAGRRGGGWLKVKPRHTLDLVVLAAEWGHGRRQGWLSNLHLGALDPQGTVADPGGFVMLGKTFKGMTDDMLRWQTERLQELAVRSDDWVVHVRPELVVEVAFDGVQTSPRYPGGVALRFARIKGYRLDKTAADCDTIDSVLAIHAR